MFGCGGPKAMFRILPIVAVCSFLITPVRAQKDFPDGPAREYVNKICLQCHEPSQLLNQNRTESDWRATISRMAQKGVPGTPEQYDAITAYMAKNFPKREDATKINMNKAKPDEIVAVIGLTPAEAQALVAYREKHGDYREWGEMLVVYGVDGRKLEAAKDKMSF
jgi:competence ComEA-like helix-hairpin-helix protein